MVILYYGRKTSYIALSECRPFVCFQLQPDWTEGPDKWTQNNGTLEPTMCNTFSPPSIECIFPLIKHCLSDLPLTGPLYSTVVLKDV